MAYALVLQPEFRYVIWSFFLITVVNFGLGERVAFGRKKYGVKLPHFMASGSSPKDIAFNCLQRGHMNMLETLQCVLVALLVSGAFYPTYSAICGVLYAIGRVIYALGYSSSPKNRAFGQLVAVPAFLALVYGCWCAGQEVASA
mmetsp:Transcript_3295/g.6261  ORF Transcript_3295/g.6261 Transcript_3295/m.6261 type:complete len:144 (+) Transcript_3295:71-502(+)